MIRTLSLAIALTIVIPANARQQPVFKSGVDVVRVDVTARPGYFVAPQ